MSNDRGFVFIQPDAHLTPPEVEQFLILLNNEIAKADRELTEARDRELEAYKIYRLERNKLLLSAECPKVGRSRANGDVTVDEREAWIEDQIEDQVWIHETSKVARENAESYVWALKDQFRIVQSLGVFARLSFEAAGRRYP